MTVTVQFDVLERSMSEHVHPHHYVPAMGQHRFLPLYNILGALLGMKAHHRTLVREADLGSGRTLEIGCGTGNLTVLAKKLHPEAELVGIDPDPDALANARKKARRMAISFDHGYGQELPYPDDSFDRVLSAFMLHHLDGEVRDATLREVRRVLRPNGALYLLDFGGRVTAEDGFMAGRQLRSGRFKDNLGDAIPTALRAAGFTDCSELSSRSGWFGRVTHYRAAG